ncbi:hypothetical protein LA080_009527 [Diaporthe eres]|uniref:Cytochrome P450 n=1 Tax=Diaporthe vaccinii TaxID=105482 RepID=A0ABR4DRZ7_9PEZI|nr:hypothetical protein LA080_009527 [Diaporthe eres]
MAAHGTAAAIALPILTLLAYLYHHATHRRPHIGIPYSRPSTRRLFGDMLELTTEAQRQRDPARTLLSQSGRLGGPVIQLFLMPFWWPLVYVSDTREIEDLLQNRLRVQAAPTMHRTTSELVALWRVRARVAGGRPVWDGFEIATYDVIWKALVGSDVDAIWGEREAGTYFIDLVPASLMSPIPGLLHFLWSLTPTWGRHWAIKRRLMSELLKLSKVRSADLGDAKDDEALRRPGMRTTYVGHKPFAVPD